jgi:hypothetical protein
MSSPSQPQPLRPVQVLHGHVSRDTAYVVEDYPFGRYGRCRIRYWIGTATAGVHQGQQRQIRQRSTPAYGREKWNRPKRDRYVELAVLYVNDSDHVRCFTVTEHLSAIGDAYIHLMGIYEQLDDIQRARYQEILSVAQQNPESWREFQDTVVALADHLDANGALPVVSETGVWQTPTHRFVIGHRLPLYLAAVDHYRATSTTDPAVTS